MNMPIDDELFGQPNLENPPDYCTDPMSDDLVRSQAEFDGGLGQHDERLLPDSDKGMSRLKLRLMRTLLSMTLAPRRLPILPTLAHDYPMGS